MASPHPLLLGALLWALVGWSVGIGFAALCRHGQPARIGAVLAWAILLVGAILFLFRPEEEVTTGEDPAAYLHSAQAFARHGALVYQDPALALLPASQRTLFRYGHRGFGYTKDACLWVKNPDTAEVGSWFQPAFPLLLVVPITLLSPWAAFFVAPLLALLAGLLLAGLVRRMTGSDTISLLAFALFLVHPAVAWNARCMRPEMPALFLALTGCTMLATYDARNRDGCRRGCGAGLALSCAVLFHVTATYVVLPAILLAAWLQGAAARAGRHAATESGEQRTRFWPGWWLGVALGGMVLVWQTTRITDPYNLKATLASPGRQGLILSAGMLFLAGVLALRYMPWHRALRALKPLRYRHAALLLSMAVAFLYLGSVAWIFVHRTDLGHVPGLPGWLTAYVSLTDFKGVAILSSRAWSLLAMLGIPCLLGIGKGGQGAIRKRLFLLLAPASLTIGWMFNYMFETRRTTTALVPLMILATAALLDALRRLTPTLSAWFAGRTRLPTDAWASAWRLPVVLPCLVALALAGSAMRGRTALYTLRNHRGTFEHYRRLSERMATKGDFVFAEYTQTAAPIEHVSGLPLLPIAWDYRSDEEYRLAESALAELVRREPDRRYLLATPFAGTLLPGLSLRPLFHQTLVTRRLTRTRGEVPRHTQERTMTMHVHEVVPDMMINSATPYIRIMDGSRLGLSGAANVMPARDIELYGTVMEPGMTMTIGPFEGSDIHSASTETDASWILVFAFPSFKAPESLTVASQGIPLRARRSQLCPGWELLDLEDAAGPAALHALEVASSEHGYLVQILRRPRAGGAGGSIPLPSEKTPFVMPQVDSQWLRSHAALALPNPRAPAALWMLLTTGRDDGVTGSLTVQARNEHAPAFELTIGEGWRWHVVSLPARDQPERVTQWYDLETTPAWDPELRGFPEDLGIRIHAVTLQGEPFPDP